ncbi:MAG: YhcH/YjgK/YiaL family protein [Dysgonamonadaceae bacterium]|jgi:YhcH/YjgK/YiaL family protein|nr:YhcH/YjgK/YiaL family protein [Dysgonamonadaceae bacterium]
MIIDSISGLKHYCQMNERFEKAFAFLCSNDIASLQTGRYEIDGDNVYATVSENNLKNTVDARLEVHDLYIDIQVPVSGSETFGWKDRSLCGKSGAYDDKKDIAFFEDKPDFYYTVHPLNIIVFFPHDAHAPLIGDGGKIKKIVIKVKV